MATDLEGRRTVAGVGEEESEERREEQMMSRVKSIKVAKSRSKANFTRIKNQLVQMISDEDYDRDEVGKLCKKLGDAQERAMEILEQLCEVYVQMKEGTQADVVAEEIETMEEQYTEVLGDVNVVLSGKPTEIVEPKDKKETSRIGEDMYRQLKRVSIPVFSGKVSQYDFWKSAFSSCVDDTKATPEYKFLQLKQYLAGEALAAIDGLGHSPMAYEAAKERLERKYGGKRRTIHRFYEEIEQFPTIKYENAKMINKFADLLDITIINMKSVTKTEDMNSGFMYLQLVKKLPQPMITRYERWRYESDKEETVEVLKEWVLKEAEFVNIAFETKCGLGESRQQTSFKKTPEKTYHAKDVKKPRKQSCKHCKGDHGVYHCEKLKSCSVPERWDHVKGMNLCFRCLGEGHQGRECKRTRKCGIGGCTKVHHQLLHQSSQPVQSRLNPNSETFKPSQGQQSPDAFTGTSHQSNMYIALRTVPVIVYHHGRELKINALLDDGSTKTYINEDVACELDAQSTSSEMTVNMLNGKSDTFQTMNVSFGLKSLNGQVDITIDANSTKDVTGSLKTINWNEQGREYSHLRGIKFPYMQNRTKVDMLIGSDYAQLHYSLHEIHGEPNEPIARLTPLGWTCVGPYAKSGQNNCFHSFFVDGASELTELNSTLKRFWEIEEGAASEITFSKNDKDILEKAESSIDIVEKRYQIDIPWTDAKDQLKDNSESATKRLANTEKRLLRDPDLYHKYGEIIQQYEEKEYISKVTESHDEAWYIPHFPVLRPEKSTTKVRIVFDASAKYQGISLNDAIHQGPSLQTDLFDVLVRFRRHSIAVACDIQEMYLQVGIPPPDRKYHRFLWRTTPESPVEKYEFNRLVFGVNASPFLAQCVSRYNARKYADEFPLAEETVLKSTYMDDSIDSVKDVETGIQLYHQLSELWQRAGMFARKWLSNSPEVLEKVPAKDRAVETDFSKNETPAVKTLGVLWHADIDCFTFKYSTIADMSEVTKRQFLSKVATLYDPLGFLVPYTVRAKMLMQKVWLSGTDWDEELTDELKAEVWEWFNELPRLQDVKIPRNLEFQEHDNSQLHTFVDASTTAYCAVTYIRNKSETNETANMNLIAAKSKVTPLKSTSVPRLELMAAVLGLKLTEKVCEALGSNINEVCFWSDSLNTLWWIRNQSRQFKPFVANRLGEIHSKTNPEQWRYVPTQVNPADLGSRGVTIDKLCEDDTWWVGPEFLRESPEKWPKNDFKPDDAARSDQKRKSATNASEHAFLSQTESTDELNRLDPERFSSWSRLVRVYAWVVRFINNCQLPNVERQAGKALTAAEIRSAEDMIISETQMKNFSGEIKSLKQGNRLPKTSRILNLNPKLDEDGLMRSDSRLKYIEFVPFDVRYPVILPRKDWVTRLIVKDFHEKCKHGGTNQTLAALSTRYWVVAAREEIREAENDCRMCRRRKARAGQQIMGPIPELRIGQSMRAFSQTAVDYAGPFFTKQGRGRPRNKRYLCLFTCMACRAVHLELSYSLDTDSFLNAFYRFVSRRGLPNIVLSDNGTNFVGAVRELKELVEALDRDKIVDSVANKGIEWRFIPPVAPHFGGVHEAMVKSAKKAIFAILGDADINDEELLTAFCGAEGLINGRPLTYQSANPEDEPVLTPNHFLHGQSGGQFAPDSVDMTTFNINKRWRRVQELVKHFWGRWFREFMPNLGARKKWFGEYRDFRVGDVVFMIDPDVGRGQWKLGKITRVYTGPDGHVRVVDIQIGNKVMKRSINRVCLIEESCDSK